MSELPLLRRGARGETVEALQRSLLAADLDPGPIDGIFGKRTDEAVRAFQEARGLAVDGLVGPVTWEALLATGAELEFEEPEVVEAPPREEFDCLALADAVSAAFLRDYPPQPVPEVEEMDIPYEYMNRLNAYRDVLYAHLRGRPQEIRAYRESVETTSTQTGRPGSQQGIADAEAVWAGLPADLREQLQAHRHCEIAFIWMLNGQKLSSPITVRNYLVLRLDNMLASVMTQMTGGPSLTPPLYEVMLYVRSGQVELYRPVTYMAYPDSVTVF